MSKLEIFEPAMCCPTGICGVEVDPVLVQFSADLQWLGEQGVEVLRHGLAQAPAAFAAHPEVLKEMQAGMDRLPITVLDGRVVSVGAYLSRAQMAQQCGLTQAVPAPAPAQPSACGCKPGACC